MEFNRSIDTLMYLSNAEDEGMTILPIHRALAREMDDGVGH